MFDSFFPYGAPCVPLTLSSPVAQPEMVDVVNRLCAAEGCSKHPNFNHFGQSMVRRRCVAAIAL